MKSNWLKFLFINRLVLKIKSFINSKLIRSSILYVITDGINKAVPFLLLPVLTTYLSPDEFGIVSNFLVFSSILLIFVGLNVDGAISANYFKYSKKQLADYVATSLVIAFAGFLLTAACIYFFKNIIFSYTKLLPGYQLLTVVLVFFQVFTLINMTLWRLEEKALKFGIYQILQTVLNLGLSLYFIIQLYRGWQGRVEGNAIAVIVFGLLSLYFLKVRGYLRFEWKLDYMVDALKFGLPLVPHSLSLWMRSGIDKILLTKYLGEAANGIYSTGLQFGVLLGFVTTAFNNAFIPFLFKKLTNNNEVELEKEKKKLVKMTYMVMLVYIVLGLLFTLLSILAIKYLLPGTYQDSTQFVFWAMLSQVFQGMYFLTGNYIFYAKKTKHLPTITFSCGLLQLGLSYFFIITFGAIGAAYSAVIASFVNFIAVWYYSNISYAMPWFSIFTKKKI